MHFIQNACSRHLLPKLGGKRYSYSLCSSHGWVFSARAHVQRPPHRASVSRKRLGRLCSNLVYGLGSLSKCLPQVMGRVHLHMRTCAPLFHKYSVCWFLVNGWADCVALCTPLIRTVLKLKEVTHLRFFENIVNNFHNTVFHSLFRNTNYLFPKLNKSFRKITLSVKASLSEPYSTVGMAPPNHIQAAASWLAAQPTKWYPPPGSEFLSDCELRIPSL